jgi:hypothetical protein
LFVPTAARISQLSRSAGDLAATRSASGEKELSFESYYQRR